MLSEPGKVHIPQEKGQEKKMKSKEEFEDTKGVIWVRKSENRQHNGQKTKNKRTNNDLQNIHIKQDRATRIPLKTWVNSGPPER